MTRKQHILAGCAVTFRLPLGSTIHGGTIENRLSRRAVVGQPKEVISDYYVRVDLSREGGAFFSEL
jgi:hypothetical protein